MAHAELVVALDLPNLKEATDLVDRLPANVLWYKVGPELFVKEGPRALQELRSRGKNVFLDLKWHDIPRTVERAVAAAAEQGARMITVHASGGQRMLEEAVRAARGVIRVVAVTVLTSLDESDVRGLGVPFPIAEYARTLARKAMEAGVDGLVCSPREVAILREEFGSRPILVVPGIRPSGEAGDDQKRIATPRAAAQAGADYLVVGRPVLEAPDPRKAALEILAEISS